MHDRFLLLLAGVTDPEEKRRRIDTNLSVYLKKHPNASAPLITWLKATSIQT